MASNLILKIVFNVSLAAITGLLSTSFSYAQAAVSTEEASPKIEPVCYRSNPDGCQPAVNMTNVANPAPRGQCMDKDCRLNSNTRLQTPTAAVPGDSSAAIEEK